MKKKKMKKIKLAKNIFLLLQLYKLQKLEFQVLLFYMTFYHKSIAFAMIITVVFYKIFVNSMVAVRDIWQGKSIFN